MQAAIWAAFKADRNAPMDVEANTLELLDASNKAVFSGDVKARQGDLLLRTAELTAFYSGQAGLGLADPADATPPARPRARRRARSCAWRPGSKVIINSKDRAPPAKWADFDVKANTALLGGGVIIRSSGRRPAEDRHVVHPSASGSTSQPAFTSSSPTRLRREPPRRPPRRQAPAMSAQSCRRRRGATPDEKVKACPPGRICGLIYPEKVKDKAMDAAEEEGARGRCAVTDGLPAAGDTQAPTIR